MPDALWSWIPASIRAARDQLYSEPDPDEDYKGRRVVHERPHLVPIGYVFIITPFAVLGHYAYEVITGFAPPTLAGWIVFVGVALAWSLGLYVTQRIRKP